MKGQFSTTEKSIGNQGGRESQVAAPLAIRMPVDVYSFSLALLTVPDAKKWRIPRAIGAAVLLLGIVGGTGSLFYSLSDDAVKLIETLPDAAQKIRLARLKERGTSEGAMENVQKAATQLERAASETVAPAPAAPRGVRVQHGASGRGHLPGHTTSKVIC